MEGGFSASLHLYISIAKRPSLTILPDVHMYKEVPSNFRVAFMGSFPTKKCGDGNRCSVYTIRLVFKRKMVHFTSGSYFGPCEKTFSQPTFIYLNNETTFTHNTTRCAYV
jgi:hypothetical protein